MNQRLVSQMAGPDPIQQGQMAGQQVQTVDQQVQTVDQQVQMVDQQVQMGGQQGQLGIQQGQMGQQGHMHGQRGQAQMAGPDPIWTTCPNCKTEIVSTTRKSISTFQCLVAGFLCCVCPCCFCIPFCNGSWKDVLHTCPKCNYVIGKYKK